MPLVQQLTNYYYGDVAPENPNEGTLWVHSTTGNVQLFQGGGWRNLGLSTLRNGVSSVSPSAGWGYATGAGGAVTQITNRSTGVTLNTICGVITGDATSLAAEATATFTVTNSRVAIGDVVVISVRSGPTSGATSFRVTAVAAGSFDISATNNNAAGGTADTGAPVINFAVIKAVGA